MRRTFLARMAACTLVLSLGAAAGAWGVSAATATTCVISPNRGTFVEARRDGELVDLTPELEPWNNRLAITPHDSGNGHLTVAAEPSPIRLELIGR